MPPSGSLVLGLKRHETQSLGAWPFPKEKRPIYPLPPLLAAARRRLHPNFHRDMGFLGDCRRRNFTVAPAAPALKNVVH